MNNIYIYQIWYNEYTKPNNELGINPFDCRKEPEFLKRETAHLIKFYDEVVKYGADNDYYALLSPKFYEKIKLTPKDIKYFIEKHSGYDIYLFNPYPTNIYTHTNVWEHGDDYHSGIKNITQELFKKAKLDFNINLHHQNNQDTAVYCNYWVAKKTFFDEYIAFIKNLDKVIENSDNEYKNKIFSPTWYFKEDNVCMYPFIFERLISTYLLINKHIRTKPYLNYSDISIYNFDKIEVIFYKNGLYKIFDGYFSKQDVHNNISMTKNLRHILRPDYPKFTNKFISKIAKSIMKKYSIVSLIFLSIMTWRVL